MNAKPHPAQILFTEKHPLTAALNMKFHFEDPKHLRVDVAAPAEFADRDGIHVHSGFATLLLDTVLGSCAIGKLEEMKPIATMKLSCNHVRRIQVGEEVQCRATWLGEENTVSFINGDIMRIADETVLSTAVGSFMVGTASRPLSEKKQ